MLYFSKVYNYLADFKLGFKKSWEAVFSPRIFKIYLLAILGIQLLGWYISIYVFRNLSGELLILHYNVDFGTDLIGPPSRVFSGPLFGLFVLFANTIFALLLNRRRQSLIVNHFLIAGAMVINAFVLLALFTIYLNNFR